jgi:acyl dehydratase
MSDVGLLRAQITDEAIALTRERIGYPNPFVRDGYIKEPWNVYAHQDAFRRFALCIGDDNPLYCSADYAGASRWQAPLAQPGFEMSMGVDRSPLISQELDKHTRGALRGVHLFHSGGEGFYYAPIREGLKLYSSKWIADVQDKKSEFAGRSAIVTNGYCFWDNQEQVYCDGVDWFVHAERRKTKGPDSGESKRPKEQPAHYTDAQLKEIDDAYANEYRRGADTLYLEDVKVGDTLPTMVKGPLTITDLIGAFMAAGWYSYGSWPYRIAYLNRKVMPGFYTRNEFNAWDTLQRLHWDAALAAEVGVPATYDIGPMRKAMLCHYMSNYGGDDAWLYRLRYEFRRFNYMGDTTWISGVITDAGIDPKLGPRLEIDLKGVNQRGDANVIGSATLLVASRKSGPAQLPPRPPITPYRRASA